MKVCIVQVGDIHLKTKKQLENICIEDMVKSICSIGKFDKFILIVNGDLTYNGDYEQFTMFHTFIKNLLNKFKEYNKEYINIVCVPGNHDLVFKNITFNPNWFDNDSLLVTDKNNIISSYKKGLLHYNFCMKNLKVGEFSENEYYKLNIPCEDKQISFLMLNSTFMSTIKDTNSNKKNDIGKHFISEKSLDEIVNAEYGNINICISHFPIEYFELEQREKIDKLLQSKFNFVFTAHEHLGGGFNKIDDSSNSCTHILCEKLSDAQQNCDLLGFNVLVINLEENKFKKFIFHKQSGKYYNNNNDQWNNLIEKKSLLRLNEDFENYIETDSQGRNINNYFIFPGVTLNDYGRDGDYNEKVITSIDDLSESIKKYRIINIKGDSSSGKTTLAKFLFRKLHNEGNVPILFYSEMIKNGRVDKLVKTIIEHNYKEEQHLYDKVMQSDNKIAIIDDYINISENAARNLKDFLLEHKFHIVTFLSNEIDLDVYKRIKEIIYDDSLVLDAKLNLFSLSNRSKVIKRILSTKNDIVDKEKVFNTITNVLNKQISLFNLNPSFIVDYVYQYISSYNINFGLNENLFGEVYRNNIFNKINKNSESVSVDIAFSILQEIAFFVHFNHKFYIEENEINNIIEQYKNDHRQIVSSYRFIRDMINSNILKMNENSEYSFCDINNLAYFVAMALINKSNTCDLHEEYQEIFEYIAFGINSDIVLFLSLLSGNHNFLKEIVKIAHAKFENLEEFYFENATSKNSNIKLFELSTRSLNYELKNDTEDNEREISKLEESSYSKSMIELKSPYFYLDEDVNSNENKLKCLLKTIEIICKVLPSFAHRIDKNLQDEIADIIYTYPNKFIYLLFKEIDDKIEKIVCDLYKESFELNKEKIKNIVNYDVIENAIVDVAYSVLINLYQLVSLSVSSEKTIITLNDYLEKHVNANNDILNLLMKSRIDNFVEFVNMINYVDKNYMKSIERIFLRIATRNFIVGFKKEIKGDIQSLVDKVFPNYKKNLINAKKKGENKN